MDRWIEAAEEQGVCEEALRRRIDSCYQHLHRGVRGTLAIAYLRQISDDEDELTALMSRAH
jgi:hypothetical protein